MQEAVACVGGAGGGGIVRARHMLGAASNIERMQEAVACVGGWEEGGLLEQGEC